MPSPLAHVHLAQVLQIASQRDILLQSVHNVQSGLSTPDCSFRNELNCPSPISFFLSLLDEAIGFIAFFTLTRTGAPKCLVRTKAPLAGRKERGATYRDVYFFCLL